MRNVKGSHRVYQNRDLTGAIKQMSFPLHGKEFKTIYTKKLIEFLELREKYEDTDDES